MSAYFQGLNYGLANEDTWIEHELAPAHAKSFFSVCGSGSRVTPLMAKNPEQIHVVDLSDVQLALFRLRLAAIKKLDYEDYLFFLGYTKRSQNGKNRPDLMSVLGLNSEDESLWKAQESLWKEKGFIYLGRWEQHFMKMGKIYQIITRGNVRPLFETQNLQEQQALLSKYWHPKLFKAYIKIIMNEWVANRLLYKGSYAGGKDKKTMEISAADFVFREINDLFQSTWVRKNYFLNMIFLNEVSDPTSFPAECDENIFKAVKASETKVHFHKQNLLELLLQQGHDFYSLSDTFSYMEDSDVKDFLSKLPSSESGKSKIVIRTFMRKPSFSIQSPWVEDARLNKDLAQKDCTRMYEFSVLDHLS